MKKRILALVLAVLTAAALCACGGGKSQEAKPADNPAGSTGEKAQGGEITVGIAADLDTSLDPHVSSSSAGTREVLFNIFEGLMKPDTDGNLIPAVAESYTVNEAADAYTFTLRKGVRFHNGQAVTVGDVVYSLSRAAGLETGEPLVATLSGVASVEAEGEDKVVVTLKAPDTEFLAYATAAIIPADSDPAQGLIGTGPFRFVSRVPQESIVLERFADYWGEGAKLDRVTLKVIPDGQTMVLSLRSGAIDMAGHLEASQADSLQDLTVLEGSMNLVQALYLNNRVAPFDDVRVRQALCYLIDKHAVIDLAADGHGFPVGSSMYPAFGRYFDETLTDAYTLNVEKAKSLLAEAGYPNGFRFTITVPSNYTPHVDAAQVIVNLLDQANIGVSAKIEQVEWATWYSEVYKEGKFETTVCGMDASTLTASAMLSRFTSDSKKNFIGFASPEYDAAYAAAVSSVDAEAQTAHFKECEAILSREAANVYLQDLADFFVLQPNISGYRFYPLYVMDLSTVYRVS